MRFILFCVLFFCGPAYAEWEQWESASEVRESESLYTVERDGSYIEDSQSIFQLKNRNGIERNSVSMMEYSQESEVLEFSKAETINGDAKIAVDPANMEDKPLASNAAGFSTIRRHMFPFPAVREDSKLVRKYRRIVKHPPLKDFFFYGAAWTDATLRTSIRIVSALPLEYTFNDPNGVLQIITGKKEGKYTIEIKQDKKIFHAILNETQASWPLSQYTWVRVSSTKSWSEFARAAGRPFENVLAQPLPPALSQIAEMATKESTTLAKINTALRLFSEKFRYFGDWRQVNGGYVPRNLSTISDSGYGDCKDFATSMTAILRKIEIPAHVAFVNRSWTASEMNTSLPSFFDFNHAIVFVDKEKLWLDPTNSFRPAELIPADISSRTALVLDMKNPRLETTASENISTNSTTYRTTFSPMKEGWDTVQWHVLAEGSPAFYEASKILFSGESFEKRARLSLEANQGTIRNLKFLAVTQPSRENMSRFEANYQLENLNVFYRTNLGEMTLLGLDSDTVRAVNEVIPQKRVSDFQISTIRKYVAQQLFKERTAAGKLPNCRIHSPWIDIERTFEQTSAGLQKTDTIVTKARRIPVADIRSPVFQKLQDEIRDCSYKVALVLQRTQP